MSGRSAFSVELASLAFLPGTRSGLRWLGCGVGDVTLKKLECSKQAYALNTLAWNNVIGLWSYLCWSSGPE